MGKNRTAKTTAEPWRAAQPAMKDVLSEARSLYNSGGMTVNPYQGNRVADFSAMTNAGIGMLGGIQGQTPQVRAAFNDMLDGGGVYRDFDKIRNRVADQTKAQLASTFAGGGINSGLAGDTYSRAMGEALAGVEYGAYNDAQNRRLAALGLAPQMQGLDMNAARARLLGGGLRDDLAQRKIDANMARYYEGENADIDALMRYSGLASGMGGLGSTGTQTAPNPNSVFSAGATGLGTYGALAANPVTAPLAIGGGILAGLGSLF